MSGDPKLFDTKHAEWSEGSCYTYGDDPPHVRIATSRDAAKSMAPITGKLQRQVYDFIVVSGNDGMTDDDLEVATDMRHQTASARRRELQLAGRITQRRDDAGNVVLRKTRSGRKAVVWVVK